MLTNGNISFEDGLMVGVVLSDKERRQLLDMFQYNLESQLASVVCLRNNTVTQHCR